MFVITSVIFVSVMFIHVVLVDGIAPVVTVVTVVFSTLPVV